MADPSTLEGPELDAAACRAVGMEPVIYVIDDLGDIASESFETAQEAATWAKEIDDGVQSLGLRPATIHIPVSTDPAASHALQMAALEKWGLWPVLLRVLGTQGWACFMQDVGAQGERHGYCEAHHCHRQRGEKIYTFCVAAATSTLARTAKNPLTAIARTVAAYGNRSPVR